MVLEYERIMAPIARDILKIAETNKRIMDYLYETTGEAFNDEQREMQNIIEEYKHGGDKW